jgi:acylphosphatase
VSEEPVCLQAKRYFVAGTVQGVGFRFFARRTARRLGLAGYAKNLGDGRVEAYAIGPREALEEFQTQLGRGPAGASVSSVAEEEAQIEPRFAEGFSIEY